jgi:clan AA aspartic protease
VVILGETSDGLEILVTLTVIDRHGGPHELPAILDTGFTGHLTLPPEIIEALALPEDSSSTVTLGDGSERSLQKYAATILWEQQERPVTAYRAEGLPLIGMRLLKGMVAVLHISDGGPAMLFRP